MDDVLIIGLSPNETNDQIRDRMKKLKHVREHGMFQNIACLINGFDEDPRELNDIPECIAFCRRLVSLGFISYLDFSTQFDPREFTASAWGAAEVWMCAERRADGIVRTFTKELIDEITEAVKQSNAIADAALGKYRPRR